MGEQITRKDVAEKAGVSVSVVSRALNNSGYVDRDKKERIIEIARELGYVPNPVAMSLQQRRTKQIIFYCKDLHNAFNIEVYRGIREGAEARGYHALINGGVQFEDIRSVMTDGIILQNERYTERFVRTCGRNYNIPVVAISYGDLRTLDKSIPYVEWDLFTGMENALAYLRKRGHRYIAYASPYLIDHDDGRTKAWKANMEPIFGDKLLQYFLQATPEYMGGETREDSSDDLEEDYYARGKTAADEFLERHCRASAVICFNDDFAIGFVSQLQRAGICVPEDVSVLSFDGTLRREMTSPVLTSITAGPRNIGGSLATLLIDRIEGKRIKYRNKQRSYVVEGESVRALT